MFLVQLLVCCFMYAWMEYFVHRFDMHKIGSYRFRSHTIEHHGKKHMGVEQASLTQANSGSGFWYTLPLTLPIAWCWAAYRSLESPATSFKPKARIWRHVLVHDRSFNGNGLTLVRN